MSAITLEQHEAAERDVSLRETLIGLRVHALVVAKVPAQREPVGPCGCGPRTLRGVVMSCHPGRGAEEAVMRVPVVAGDRARSPRLRPSGAGTDSRTSAHVSARH